MGFDQSNFDESKHPRYPEGDKRGGKFAPKVGSDVDPSQEDQQQTARKKGGHPDPTHPHAGLVYDRFQEAWITRNGDVLDEKHTALLKRIGASAGYQSVSINPDPNGTIKAWVVTSNGQIKRLYDPETDAANNAQKFMRLRDFDKALPQISAGVLQTINDKGASPRLRDAAATLRMVELTGIRPGSDKELGKIKTYGASTLEGQHIRLGPKGLIELEFMGKSGKVNTRSFQDPVLHKYLSQKNLTAGQRVFLSDDTNLRDLLKKVSGKPFKVKDFRTWQATQIALREISLIPRPISEKDMKIARKRVAARVADFLNNTPAVALARYIDPHVFDVWGVKKP